MEDTAGDGGIGSTSAGGGAIEDTAGNGGVGSTDAGGVRWKSQVVMA